MLALKTIMTCKYRSSLVCAFTMILLFLVQPVAASASTNTSMEKQRKEFSEALNHLKKGHYRSFSRAKKRLEDYPLYGYLEYEYLRRRLGRVPDKRIEDFLETYQDLPVADRLLYSWLRHFARRHQWQAFLDHYEEGGGTRLQCQKALALFKTNREEEAMALVDELWVVGKSQPRTCDAPFEKWQAKGGMTREKIWQRIDLSMQARRLSLTRFLEKQLDKDDRVWVQRWRAMYRHPAENLHRNVYHKDIPIARKIVRHGIKRLARRDVAAASAAWKRIRDKHYKSEPEETQSIDQYIALRAALAKHPEALELLSELENPSEKAKEWRVRAALSKQEWWTALNWIEALPREERESENWRYWRGRILEMQSKNLPVLRTASERIFTSLAKERSYHGFLAADRMGLPYNIESQPLEFSEDELRETENIPAIQRARELFFLKRFADARREWHREISDYDEVALRKAAVLASRWGWHDRAIATVAMSEHFDDIELRFPMAYRDLIESYSGKLSVDPAWVYGVVRQESGFMTDARSHAGALGLMQIMPKTGRLAARELKTRLRSSREILDVRKNIHLGAAYLRRMLKEQGGNSALATASYNAGPYRVRKWMPETAMPADLWVESIPYTETRNYVRRVMAYTVIYDFRLDGKLEQIQKRMPDVEPKG